MLGMLWLVSPSSRDQGDQPEPNMTAIQDVMSKLFDGVNGYSISHADRAGGREGEQAFTYGEMLLEPFARILEALKPQPGETFFDLGSGTGKVLVMADQLFPFASVTGIEFLPTLHATATDILKLYEHEFRTSLPAPRGPVISKHGDMLKQDFSSADIIFVHATCMPASLIDALGEKVKACKPSTRIVLISRGFFGSPHFNCTGQFEYTNAWNTQSICYIYQPKAEIAAVRQQTVMA